MLQKVVLGESQVSIVDCVRFRTELGVDVEQTLERFLPGQLAVELSQESPTLSERFLEFAFLVLVVCCCDIGRIVGGLFVIVGQVIQESRLAQVRSGVSVCVCTGTSKSWRSTN